MTRRSVSVGRPLLDNEREREVSGLRAAHGEVVHRAAYGYLAYVPARELQRRHHKAVRREGEAPREQRPVAQGVERRVPERGEDYFVYERARLPPAGTVIKRNNIVHCPYSIYLYAAAQAPSLETMQGPSGSSGVHTRSNIGHSAGRIRPVITSPQRQGPLPAAGLISTPKRRPASKAAYSSAGRAARVYLAEAAPYVAPWGENPLHRRAREGVPLV